MTDVGQILFLLVALLCWSVTSFSCWSPCLRRACGSGASLLCGSLRLSVGFALSVALPSAGLVGQSLRSLVGRLRLVGFVLSFLLIPGFLFASLWGFFIVLLEF